MTTPTRRPGLNRDKVLDAALDLVDRKGVEALTMRRLASEFGVEAMSLYHHLPNKDALLDGVVEKVVAEVPLFGDLDGSWQERVRAYTDRFRTTLLRHPNAVGLVAARPVRTEPVIALLESALEVLVEIGFTVEEADQVLWAVIGYVLGHAQSHISPTGTVQAPEVIERVGKELEALAAKYPLMASTFEANPVTNDRERAQFDMGMDIFIAGMEKLLAAKQ